MPITVLQNEAKIVGTNIIPDGWRVVKLSDLCEIDHGYAFDGKYIVDELTDYVIVTPVNFEIGGGFKSEKLRYYRGSVDSNYILNSYDLIVTMTDLSKKGDTLGYPALIPKNSQSLFLHNQRIGKVRIISDWSTKEFLFFLLCSDEYRQYILQTASGTTVRHTSPKKILSYSCLFPPVEEQQRIAEILSSLDEAIAHTQAVIDQIQVVKRGLIQQLLNKGIPGWHEVSDIETRELSKISRKITDGSHQSVKIDVNGAIPFLYVSCIRNGQIKWEQTARIAIETYREISRGREPKDGVILYTAVGSYGEAVMLRGNELLAFQRHIAYIKPDPQQIESRFLVHWLNSSIGRSQADQVAVGNAQKTVTLKDLACFKVPIFSLNEQQKIADVLDSVDQRLQDEQMKRTQLESLKKGLMQQLLTGKLRVPIAVVEPIGGE